MFNNGDKQCPEYCPREKQIPFSLNFTQVLRNLMILPSDISAGKAFTTTSDCTIALLGASHPSLEHASLHHLALDVIQPEQFNEI